MRKFQDAILIVCKHHGSLIEYSRLLNRLGFFGLVLCSDEEEALSRVNAGVGFSHLVYDGFNFDADGCVILRKLCTRGQEIILLSEATQTQYLAMRQWAAEGDASVHIMQRPISIPRLIKILNVNLDFSAEQFYRESCGMAYVWECSSL